MKTDFDDTSSKFGLVEGEFEHLDGKTKNQLVKLMSRIMERAYRRGVQQALELYKKDAIDDWITCEPWNYRYDKSLATSIGLDGFTTTSIERLFIEEKLESIGLYEKNDE